MSLVKKIGSVQLLLVLIFFVPLEGITVSPVRCPTNKIAPHRRAASFDHVRARTFGVYYELLQPNQPNVPSPYGPSLQEKPQADDPEDCGDIEDYDETDLSSQTQPYTRDGHSENKLFFNGFLWNRPTTGRPTRPTRPSYMPSPSYGSGGYFGNNHYRPPVHQDPSDYVKPVHEGSSTENQSTYRPEVVGGPLGHVVGHPPHRPTTRPQESTTTRPHRPTRFPQRTTEATVYTTRRSRPRTYNNDGVIGSFIDLLLFK